MKGLTFADLEKALSELSAEQREEVETALDELHMTDSSLNKESVLAVRGIALSNLVKTASLPKK